MVVKISHAKLERLELKVWLSCMATVGFLTWNPSQISGTVEPAGLPMQQPAPVSHVLWEAGYNARSLWIPS